MAADPFTGEVRMLAPVDAKARRTTRLGIGLLLSLPVSWPAIGSALDGSVSFEWAVARLLLSVAASVTGVLVLGALYDWFGSTVTADGGGDPDATTDGLG